MAMKIASSSSCSWRRLHHVFRSGEALPLTASAYVFFSSLLEVILLKKMVWVGKSLPTRNEEQMSSKVENTAIALHRDKRSRYSSLTKRVSFCCLSTPLRRTKVTKVETHNDCIVRLWHMLWHILQHNKSFFLPFLLVGPEIHNSTHSFLFYGKNHCFQETCSGMGFRGVINVILRKQIEMSRSFSLVQPEPPPHPTTTRCSRAIFF